MLSQILQAAGQKTEMPGVWGSFEMHVHVRLMYVYVRLWRKSGKNLKKSIDFRKKCVIIMNVREGDLRRTAKVKQNKMQKWRNWQTRTVQVRVVEIP